MTKYYHKHLTHVKQYNKPKLPYTDIPAFDQKPIKSLDTRKIHFLKLCCQISFTEFRGQGLPVDHTTVNYVLHVEKLTQHHASYHH